MEDQERLKLPKKEKTIPYAVLLDADGVVTNPWTREVNQKVINSVFSFLQKEIPVFINTGRTLEWSEQNVLVPLMNLAQKTGTNKSIFKNFVMMGEMGVFAATFDDQGKRTDLPQDTSVTEIPPGLRKKVYDIVENGYSDTMFEGDMYKTILAPQMQYNMSDEQIQKYKKDQQRLKNELEPFIPDNFDLKFSAIAVEIKDKKHGKGIGGKRAIQILRERKITPNQVITVGDSPADIKMAEKINEEGIKVEFVFVGDPAKREEFDNFPFPVVFTQNSYDKGTEEFFDKFAAKLN